MPWALFNRPSIQLGALKSYLLQQVQGITVDTRHPFLATAENIGLERYTTISHSNWAGEALYSGLLFPDHKAQAKRLFCREIKEIKDTKVAYDELLALLHQDLLDWFEKEKFSTYNLVGFSVCFSQLISSLLAAKMIKEQHPEVPIVFGGSNCTMELGNSLLRTFPFIDFIITGEGERPLLALTRCIDKAESLPIPNVLCRANLLAKPPDAADTPPQEIPDINSLPVPDYFDYFKQVAALKTNFIPSLPVEFSRGCWWNKCSFCNLNLQWHSYRNKDHQRMKTEVLTLKKRHQSLDFTFTDNALPPHEANLFFQAMVKELSHIHFFAEIRAIKDEKKYALYQQGGLTSIQIGVEALSNSLLQRMCKGATVMDNVAALKYAAENNIRLDGNLIMEFPGATSQEVEDTLEVLQSLTPFPPLQSATFFLGHASPICTNPKNYGIKAVAQHPNNRLLFPPEKLKHLEMLIKSYQGDRIRQRKLWTPVRNAMKEWELFHSKRTSAKPPLSYRDGIEFLIIRQERPGKPVLHHRLQGLSRKIYLSCHRPVTIKELLHTFNQVKKDQLVTFLEDLLKKHLLFHDSGTYLALAINPS